MLMQQGRGCRLVQLSQMFMTKEQRQIYNQRSGKVQKEVQAKFVKSSNKDVENSAARSVFDQACGQKGHWGKYKGMDRLIRKDEHYNAEGSMLDEAKNWPKVELNQEVNMQKTLRMFTNINR